MRTKKRDKRSLISLALASLLLVSIFSITRNTYDPADRAESVVMLMDEQGMASGVVVGDGTYILTNAHVATRPGACLAVITNDHYLGRACAMWVSKSENDLALLKLLGDVSKDDDHKKLVPVAISTQAPAVGDRIVAWGHPFGLSWSMSTGTVAAVDRWIGDTGRGPYLQMDLVVAPGSSGGGIFDTKGRLVGITSFGLAPYGIPIGLNFAIPNTVICTYIHCE